MRIPTLAVTLAAAAAVVALPTTANALIPPTARDDSATAESAKPKVINVMVNDSGAETGETLSVTVKTQGDNGSVTCGTPAGSCVYTPNAGWVGTDHFTYTLSDGGSPAETATGTVTVKTVKVQSISISSSPAAITYSYNKAGELVGRPAKLTGIVRQSSTVVLPDVEVELWYKPTGVADFTKLAGPFKSLSDGSIPPYTDIQRTSKTLYQWKSATRASALKSVTVTPTLTMKWSPAKPQAVGQPFTVTGKSEPATAGDQVLLQRRSSTGAWVPAGTTTLTSQSTYAFPSITPTTSVSDLYRVVLPSANGRQQVTTMQNTIQAYDAKIMNVETDNADEFVTVKNNGVVPINLKDWTLSQGATVVTLPRCRVSAGSSVKIHSGQGVNTTKDLYLKRTDATVWPRTGSVTLKNNATPAVQMGQPYSFGP